MFVDNLKKISLTLRVVSQTGSERQETPVECRLDFIYGLSRDGLSPLEAELQQKRVGDSLQWLIPEDSVSDFLGHLYPAVCGKLQLSPGSSGELQLRITLETIEIPEDKEIIQAMARTVGHGCGGTCDCGCSS